MTRSNQELAARANAVARRFVQSSHHGERVRRRRQHPERDDRGGSPRDERTTLLGFLQRQRDLVAWKMSDASDETLASVRMPSGPTVHGIVRHSENVERSWFRDFFAGESDLRFDDSEEDPDGDFRRGDTDSRPARELRGGDCSVRRGDRRGALARRHGHRRYLLLRWIVLHLIEETGRHLGHIDLLRERADGAVGEEPSPTA